MKSKWGRASRAQGEQINVYKNRYRKSSRKENYLEEPGLGTMIILKRIL
jgi:hypothetical protein